MKLKLKTIFFSALILFSFFTCKGENYEIQKNRELLKDYFLCCCMYYGFKTTDLGNIDRSKSVYFDVLNYSLPALQKVDSLANNFISTIEISSYENKDSKNIIILSIEEYKSKRVDQFIKSMDIYMIKETLIRCEE